MSREIELAMTHRIGASFVGVILDQPAAQTARLDAHERVRLSVEVGRSFEYLHGDRVALEPVALTGERLLDDEAQEGRRPPSLLEATARENAVERGAHFSGAGLRWPPRPLRCAVLANGTHLGWRPKRKCSLK